MVKTTKEDYPIALFKKKNVLKADIEENFISNKSNSENFEDSGFPKIAFSPVKTHQQTSEGRRRSIYATIKEALKAGPKNSEKKLLEILGENDHIINKTLKMKTLKFSKAEPISGFENLGKKFSYAYFFLIMFICLFLPIQHIQNFLYKFKKFAKDQMSANKNKLYFLKNLK